MVSWGAGTGLGGGGGAAGPPCGCEPLTRLFPLVYPESCVTALKRTRWGQLAQPPWSLRANGHMAAAQGVLCRMAGMGAPKYRTCAVSLGSLVVGAVSSGCVYHPLRSWLEQRLVAGVECGGRVPGPQHALEGAAIDLATAPWVLCVFIVLYMVLARVLRAYPFAIPVPPGGVPVKGDGVDGQVHRVLLELAGDVCRCTVDEQCWARSAAARLAMGKCLVSSLPVLREALKTLGRELRRDVRGAGSDFLARESLRISAQPVARALGPFRLLSGHMKYLGRDVIDAYGTLWRNVEENILEELGPSGWLEDFDAVLRDEIGHRSAIEKAQRVMPDVLRELDDLERVIAQVVVHEQGRLERCLAHSSRGRDETEN